MIMQDENNLQIADLILKWIDEKPLRVRGLFTARRPNAKYERPTRNGTAHYGASVIGRHVVQRANHDGFAGSSRNTTGLRVLD